MLLRCESLEPPMSGVGLVSRVTPVQTALRNCTGDEGRPFGFGDQVADPKPPQAAVVKKPWSEGPWGRWSIPPHGGAVHRVYRSDFGRINAEARRAKTNRTSVSVCREQA